MEKDNKKDKNKEQLKCPQIRRQTIRAAKELGYGDDIIRQLQEATDIPQLNRIMATARERKE